MISFQRLLGREDEFCALLEASAQEACHSVAALKQVLSGADVERSLEQFAAARRQDKEITEKLTEMLVTRFVTPMEREDIEALAQALAAFLSLGTRLLAVADKVHDIDFSKQVGLLEQAVDLVRQMVQRLRAGRDLGGIKSLQNKLQQIESEADDLILEISARFYEPGFPALKAVILKDLIELLEKAVDRCRDGGNVISHILLKNS